MKSSLKKIPGLGVGAIVESVPGQRKEKVHLCRTISSMRGESCHGTRGGVYIFSASHACYYVRVGLLKPYIFQLLLVVAFFSSGECVEILPPLIYIQRTVRTEVNTCACEGPHVRGSIAHPKLSSLMRTNDD